MAKENTEAAPISPRVQRAGADAASLGVDIYGIAALATKLYQYAIPQKEIIDAVEGSVKKLLTDAGWRGKDAKEFEDAWTADAVEAGKLRNFTYDAAEILDSLATRLAEIQMRLNDNLLEAAQKGQNQEVVSIGSDNLPLTYMKALIQRAISECINCQKDAADRLVVLYSGEPGGKGWSVLNAVKSRSNDENINKSLRDKLKDAEDDLDDTLHDDDFDWDGMLSWAGGGAGVGTAFGGVAGLVIGGVGGMGLFSVPAGAAGAGAGAGIGAAAGGAVGLVVGGVVGGGKWVADQIDDWF